MRVAPRNERLLCRLFFGATLLLVLSAAAPAERPAAAAPRPATAAAEELRALLELHNAWRREWKAETPPLAWAADLAQSAQAWSDGLARSNRMEHESPLPEHVFGENISYGTDPAAAAELWYTEKAYYAKVVEAGKECTPKDLTMEDYARCGHYANAIDPRFTKLGCGMSGSFLTCRYR